MKLGFGSKRLLSIDWDRRDLRMVLVRPKGEGVELIKAVSIPISPEIRIEDAEALGAFAREAMRQARISVKSAMLSIPREKVVLNTLSLPPTPAEELAALVRFQIVKELPFAAEQAVLDFAVSGSHDAKSSCTVLVAAVRQEELGFCKAFAAEAGLAIERVGLRPFANLLAATSNSPQLAQKNLLLVEVGPQLTEIDIVRQGVLAFSRSASVAVPEPAPTGRERVEDSRIATAAITDVGADERSSHAVSELMVEIIRSYEAYRATDPGIRVDHVLVCGGSGLEPMLAQSLAARFATHVEMYAPQHGLGLSAQRARELRGFSAAVGLAVAHRLKGLSYIDFLHPKKPVTRRSLRLKKVPVVTAAAILLVGSLVTARLRLVSPLKTEVAALEKECASLKKKERDVLEFKAQVEALDEWMKSEQVWPEVLALLTELFPPEREAFVSRLDFDTHPARKGSLRESSLKLRFRTASLGTVNGLSTRLAEAGFVNVVPGRETHSESSADGYTNDTGIDAELPLRKPPPPPAAEPEPLKEDSPTASAREGGDAG